LIFSESRQGEAAYEAEGVVGGEVTAGEEAVEKEGRYKKR